MSFGLRDEDWVEPDPEPIIKCRDCEFWERCPSGCEWGWCTTTGASSRERTMSADEKA